MGISVWQILIVLLVVIVLFGTSKLRNVGSDLGSALKGFKKAMKDDESETEANKQDADFDSIEKPAAKTNNDTVEGGSTQKTEKQTSKD